MGDFIFQKDFYSTCVLYAFLQHAIHKLLSPFVVVFDFNPLLDLLERIILK
jgi:hypothetical protein